MRCNNAVQKSPVAWEAFELGKRAGLFFASEAQANCKGLPAQPIETLEFSVRSQYPLNLLAGMNIEAPMGMFRLEFCLPFQESIHGGEEILQVFLILPHQVFGPLQEFFRS